MEKEFIKKVHTVMLPPRRVVPSNKLTEPNDVFVNINPSTGIIITYTVEQIIRCGIKINEVRGVSHSNNPFRELLVEKMIETSIHIENDNYNINPQSETIIKDQYGLK